MQFQPVRLRLTLAEPPVAVAVQAAAVVAAVAAETAAETAAPTRIPFLRFADRQRNRGFRSNPGLQHSTITTKPMR